MDRRTLLKASGAAAAGIGLGHWHSPALAAEPSAKARRTPRNSAGGWAARPTVSTASRSSRRSTRTASLGLHYIEAYPGQKLSADSRRRSSATACRPRTARQVKKKLADAGVKLVNFGVTGLPRTPAAARSISPRTWGSRRSSPSRTADAFDALDKLCEEFGINVALHNHPKPSPYWNPDTVLKACKGRSKRIGACCDTGHWMRSGINPIERLKKLEGGSSAPLQGPQQVGGNGGHDVPWGTGKGDVKGMLTGDPPPEVQGACSPSSTSTTGTKSLPEIAQVRGVLRQGGGRAGRSDGMTMQDACHCRR